jgi:hypothetical protein
MHSERIAWLAPSIRLSPVGMIPISEKSSGGPLVDWVPERHDRKYTEPAAMSIRIAATPSAWLRLMREAHPVSAPSRPWTTPTTDLAYWSGEPSQSPQRRVERRIPARARFAADSPLEESGFELLVPLSIPRATLFTSSPPQRRGGSPLLGPGSEPPRGAPRGRCRHTCEKRRG